MKCDLCGNSIGSFDAIGCITQNSYIYCLECKTTADSLVLLSLGGYTHQDAKFRQMRLAEERRGRGGMLSRPLQKWYDQQQQAYLL